MKRAIIGLLAVIAAIGAAFDLGHRDGQEHRTEVR